jgi:hypothetical protein
MTFIIINDTATTSTKCWQSAHQYPGTHITSQKQHNKNWLSHFEQEYYANSSNQHQQMIHKISPFSILVDSSKENEIFTSDKGQKNHKCSHPTMLPPLLFEYNTAKLEYIHNSHEKSPYSELTVTSIGQKTNP